MNYRRLSYLGAALLAVSAGCSKSSLTLNAFTPSAVTFSPPGGPISGGGQLTLTGNFSDQEMSITVGGTNCPITMYSSSEVTCTLPATSSANWASVALTQSGQEAVTLTQTYAYGSNVIGELTFMANALNYQTALSQPSYALAVGTSPTQLYISDSQAGRVTIYGSVPTQSSAAPTAVLGQNDLTGDMIPFTTTAAYALTMGSPKSMCTDGTRLMIVDSGHNRVLIYATVPSSPTDAPTYVLGQTGFTGEQANQGSQTPSASTLNAPQGIYCDANDNIIVADTGNNRVLLWNQPITASGQAANVVLGQTGFTEETANQGGSVSSTTLSGPRAVLYDSTNTDLFVADSGNQRVLIWTALPTTSTQDAAANLVIGPSTLTSGDGGGCVQGGFTDPAGLALVNDYLYVSDSSLHRFQAWSTTGINSTWINGQLPTYVIGQNTFTVCAANQNGTPALGTFRSPTGLSTNGTALFVADTGNNRVQIYSTAPTSTGAASNVFLGQSTASGVNPAYTLVSPSFLRNPQYAAIFSGALYIADPDMNRVMMYSPVPTATGASASFVLGQPNMTTTIPNSVTDVLSAQTLSGPKGIFLDGSNNLYVADANNNRVLVFSSIPSANDPTASIVLGQSSMNTGTAAVTAAGLQGVSSVCEANDQLLVADPTNNRVLVFNTWSTAGGSGQSATYVIGQSNLTSNTANMGGTASASTLSDPAWLACNSSNLIVTDAGNQRILVYSLPITGNTPSASLVLGQTGFASTQANQGATAPSLSTIFNPHGVAIDGTKLYVADGFNNRILKWNNFTTATSGQAADLVYGQTSGSGFLPNAGARLPSLNTLFSPAGLSVSNGLLVISDANNARVLIIPEP